MNKTVSVLRNTRPIQVPVNRIRSTNEIEEDFVFKNKKILESPIVLVRYRELYVVDGNHRLAYMKKNRFDYITAWIIDFNDQINISRRKYYLLSAPLEKWKTGKITLGELKRSAKSAHLELI